MNCCSKKPRWLAWVRLHGRQPGTPRTLRMLPAPPPGVLRSDAGWHPIQKVL